MIYTPSVSQYGQAVYVLHLDVSKGKFSTIRSRCVVDRHRVADDLRHDGRRFQYSCIQARERARSCCALLFGAPLPTSSAILRLARNKSVEDAILAFAQITTLLFFIAYHRSS